MRSTNERKEPRRLLWLTGFSLAAVLISGSYMVWHSGIKSRRQPLPDDSESRSLSSAKSFRDHGPSTGLPMYDIPSFAAAETAPLAPPSGGPVPPRSSTTNPQAGHESVRGRYAASGVDAKGSRAFSDRIKTRLTDPSFSNGAILVEKMECRSDVCNLALSTSRTDLPAFDNVAKELASEFNGYGAYALFNESNGRRTFEAFIYPPESL